jgi:hypothetical protein
MMTSFTSVACAALFACVCCQLVIPVQGQDKTLGAGASQRSVEQEMDKSSRLAAAEERYLKEFLTLPPKERVRLWKEGKNIGGFTNWNMREALYVAGLDAVPYLADIVRHDTSDDAVRAVQLLCRMDKFVPDSALPLPEAGGVIYVRPLKTGGVLNDYMTVDGRRIGKEGLDAVMWAAEQTEHDDLRFHAREASGLLEQDLKRLPLAEQIKEWRRTVVESKGYLGMVGNPDTHTVMFHLSMALIEQAPDSIPPLLEMLESDTNPYVREGIIGVLHLIDSGRVRLRGIKVGREAIEAIQRALAKGNLKPTYNDREAAQWIWRRWSAEFYRDDFYLHNGSEWALLALAFEKFYGEPATKRHRNWPTVELIEAKPEMRQFITYLTDVDPFFPGWEYSLAGANSQVLHPLFRKKIERYYEYWKRFKASARSAAK